MLIILNKTGFQRFEIELSHHVSQFQSNYFRIPTSHGHPRNTILSKKIDINRPEDGGWRKRTKAIIGKYFAHLRRVQISISKKYLKIKEISSGEENILFPHSCPATARHLMAALLKLGFIRSVGEMVVAFFPLFVTLFDNLS